MTDPQPRPGTPAGPLSARPESAQLPAPAAGPACHLRHPLGGSGLVFAGRYGGAAGQLLSDRPRISAISRIENPSMYNPITSRGRAGVTSMRRVPAFFPRLAGRRGKTTPAPADRPATGPGPAPLPRRRQERRLAAHPVRRNQPADPAAARAGPPGRRLGAGLTVITPPSSGTGCLPGPPRPYAGPDKATSNPLRLATAPGTGQRSIPDGRVIRVVHRRPRRRWARAWTCSASKCGGAGLGQTTSTGTFTLIPPTVDITAEISGIHVQIPAHRQRDHLLRKEPSEPERGVVTSGQLGEGALVRPDAHRQRQCPRCLLRAVAGARVGAGAHGTPRSRAGAGSRAAPAPVAVA